MTKFRAGFLIVFLVACSVWDIRFRRIPFWFLLSGVILGTILEFTEKGIGMLLFWNLAPGIVLLLISFAVPKQLGSGDGWMLMGVGALTGWAEGLFLLETGLLFMVPVAFCCLFVRKKREQELPFAPFLLAACFCGIVFGQPAVNGMRGI